MTKLAGLSQMHVLTALVIASDDGQHCLTLDDLSDRLQSPRREIVKRIQALIANEFATSARIGCYAATPKGYKRQMDGGEIVGGNRKCQPSGKGQTPVPSAMRSRIWRAFRTTKRATVAELVQLARQPQDKNPVRSARNLMTELVRAGYAIKMPRRKNPTRNCSNGENIYWLQKSTGNFCPKFRTNTKTGETGLYDPNTEQFIPFSEGHARIKAVGMGR